MREFEYKLQKEVNGEPNPYSGKVVIKLPKFSERNKLLREVNFKRSDAGKDVDANDNLEALDRLAKVVSDHVLKLEVKKGKQAFHSLDELEYDNNVTSFYTEIGMLIINGVDLGNV